MWAELMLALGKTSELKALGLLGSVVVLESRPICVSQSSPNSSHNMRPPTDTDCKLIFNGSYRSISAWHMT